MIQNFVMKLKSKNLMQQKPPTFFILEFDCINNVFTKVDLRWILELLDIQRFSVVYFDICNYQLFMGLPGGSTVKNPPANAEESSALRSIPALGRSPGGGNGNPFQCSFLNNPMNRRAWQATVHGVTKSRTLTEATEHTYIMHLTPDSRSNIFC